MEVTGRGCSPVLARKRVLFGDKIRAKHPNDSESREWKMSYSAGYKCLNCGYEFDPRLDLLSDKVEDIRSGVQCRQCGCDNLECLPCMFDSRRSTDAQLVYYFSNSRTYIAYIAPSIAFQGPVVASEVPEIMFAFLTNLADESGVTARPSTESGNKMRRVSESLEYNLVEELLSQIRFLEALLFLQSVLGDKFYRDHLTHMARVMLLAHLIGDMLGLGKNELVACALAGLFHDIAYPISKAPETIREVSKSLGRCYPYFDVKSSELMFSVGRDNVDRILKICDKQALSELGDETNHGFLSGLTLLHLWKLANLPTDADKVVVGTRVFTTGELVDLPRIIDLAARAMALHDPDIRKTVRYSEEPVSAILILADELQDWGRPLGWDEERWEPMPNLDSLLVSKEKIHVTLDYSRNRGRFLVYDLYSPLFQIPPKQKNLARLLLDGSFPELSLNYKLVNDYITLSKESILSLAKEVEKGANRLLRNPVWRLKTRKRIPDDFKQLKDWLGIFSRRVSNSKIAIYLSFHPFTGEYVVHSDAEMPAEITTYRSKEGRLEWNYWIRKLTTPVKTFRRLTKLGAVSGLFGGWYSQYDLSPEETIAAFRLIDDSDTVANFVALVQLFPYLYYQTEAIRGQEYFSEFPYSFLHRSYDPRCQFLILEKAK